MKRMVVSAGDRASMNYGVFYPEKYEDLPLLVYLHGAGERGTVYDHIYRHGVPELIAGGREIPAVVLCPQCPADRVWDNVVTELKAIIDTVAERFSIKPDRICLTGSSMGGFGTWMTALTYPDFFAGIAPVAGGGMMWRAARLVKMPVRAFHGTEDDVVPIAYSEMMVDGVNKSGGSAELIRLSGLGHNDGIAAAYSESDLIDRLLSCRRTDFTPVPEPYSQCF